MEAMMIRALACGAILLASLIGCADASSERGHGHGVETVLDETDTAPPLPSHIAIEVDTMPETKTVRMAVEGAVVDARVLRFDWGPLVSYLRSPGTHLDFDNHGFVIKRPMGQYDPVEAMSLFMSLRFESLEQAVSEAIEARGGSDLAVSRLPVDTTGELRGAYRLSRRSDTARTERYLIAGEHDVQPFVIDIPVDPHFGLGDARLVLTEARWLSTGNAIEGIGAILEQIERMEAR